MKLVILTLAFFLIVCMSCRTPHGSVHNNTGPADTAKPVTVDNIRKQRPSFPGYTGQKLNILDTMRYLRVVLNNNRLVKTWMVFYDHDQRKWVTLTWQGKGENNRILIDTTFKSQIGLVHFYEDVPTFYCAESVDNGITWQRIDMSCAPLGSCKHPDLHKREMAQLVVSNDFMNADHLPSVSYIWQWNYDPPLIGDGPAATWDFSKLCEAAREISIKQK